MKDGALLVLRCPAWNSGVVVTAQRPAHNPEETSGTMETCAKGRGAGTEGCQALPPDATGQPAPTGATMSTSVFLAA